MAKIKGAIKFDDLKAQAAENFGDFILELGDDVEVTLTSPFNMSKDKREALRSISKDPESGEELEEMLDVYHNWVRLVAASEESAELLIAALGEQLALWKTIQDSYIEQTQAPEA